jgi:ABC-type Fe3+-siderophore transport system permease subunit
VLLCLILIGVMLISSIVPALRQPFDPWLFVNWRWPRIVAALAAGALLSLAGALMQGLTGNDMAGPEVLGVSSGAALGVVSSFILLPVLSPAAMLGFAFLGACLAFAALLLTIRGTEHSPNRLLLSGVAIGTMVAALISLVIASGDPRAVYVLAWMSGPTYRASGFTALVALVLAFLLPIIALAAARPLRILPLGQATSTALGVAVPRTRVAILALAGLATAGGVLIVGPLSFVGLIAPHLGRALGFVETRVHLIASALVGALVMVLADGLGRTLLFPYEIPAGILASLFGAPYFLWAVRPRRR